MSPGSSSAARSSATSSRAATRDSRPPPSSTPARTRPCQAPAVRSVGSDFGPGMVIAVPLELAASPLGNGRELGDAEPVRAGHRGHGQDPRRRRGRVLQGGRGRGGAGQEYDKCAGEGQPGASRDAGPAGGEGRDGRGRRDRRAGAAARPVREGGTGKAPGQGLHDPGDRLDDADAGARVPAWIAALAGDLALVPWARPWRQASARSAGDWRNALGPVPLEELRDLVLGSAWREHQGRGCPGTVTIGKRRPLRAGSLERDAAAGAGHAREQGVLRHRGHQR